MVQNLRTAERNCFRCFSNHLVKGMTKQPYKSHLPDLRARPSAKSTQGWSTKSRWVDNQNYADRSSPHTANDASVLSATLRNWAINGFTQKMAFELKIRAGR